MLAEFLDEVRRRLDAHALEKTMALRACQSLDDLRRGQGYIDGIERPRVIFDAIVRLNWSHRRRRRSRTPSFTRTAASCWLPSGPGCRPMSGRRCRGRRAGSSP